MIDAMELGFNSEGLEPYIGSTVSVDSGAYSVEQTHECPLCHRSLRLEQGRLPQHSASPMVHCIASGKVLAQMREVQR